MKNKPEPLRFAVHGTPAPAGSKRGFPYHGKDGKQHVAIVDASGTKGREWRALVKDAAREAIKRHASDDWPTRLPITVSAEFIFPRPKSHYGTGKNAIQLKRSAPRRHIIRPDATKLWRAVEDALTGIVWVDDAQVDIQVVSKEYGAGDAVGVFIDIDMDD